jgi:hypothetical protein
MQQLQRMFYVSRSTKTLTAVEVQSILHVSERNNRRRDITGCLLYSGEFFAQTLEGPEDELRKLVARIRTDPRHTEVHVVIDEATSARICPAWSMGLIYSPDLAAELASLASTPVMPREGAQALMTRMKNDSVMGSL